MDDLRPSDPPAVGRYRILGRLGTGGMGVVYLAEGPRGRVALKLVRSDLGDDPSFRARFRREVQASFRVSSTHTAKLIDFDTEADQPWMATEYVDGPSLDELIRVKGPLGHDDQLALATGLAQALEAIHDLDVVHRDLKPANILLNPAGPKVIDFGIAAAADAARITSSGLMVGSPGWLAPEQIEAGDATPASDIFSFGLVLCFAASGEPPFGTGATDALLFRAMNAPPNVPLDRLARPLHRPVLAAISRDPARRPSARDLLGFLGDAGVGTTTVVTRGLLDLPAGAAAAKTTPPKTTPPKTTPPNTTPPNTTPPQAPPTPAPQAVPTPAPYPAPGAEPDTRPPGTRPPAAASHPSPPPPPPAPAAVPSAGFGGGAYGGPHGGWHSPPPPKKRPAWVVPAAAAAGVLVVAGAVVGIVLGTGGSSTSADPTPSPVPPVSSGPVTVTPGPSSGSPSALIDAALVTAKDFPSAVKTDARAGITRPCNESTVTPPSGTDLRGLINDGVTGGNIINETVAVLPSERAAVTVMDELTASAEKCTTYSSTYDGNKTDEVTVGSGPSAFGVGDDSLYFTQTYRPTNYSGATVSTGTAFVRQGTVVIKLVTAYGSQADPGKTKALAGTLADRVAAAG